MSTRSTIGIKSATTGLVRGIYCHSDGYIDYNGVLLDCFYKTPENAQKIIDQYITLSGLCAITDYTRDRSISSRWDYSNVDTDGKKWYALHYLYTHGQIPKRYSEHQEKCYWDVTEDEICTEEFAYLYDEATQQWFVKGHAYQGKWYNLRDAIRLEMAANGMDFTADVTVTRSKKGLRLKPTSSIIDREWETAYKTYVAYREELANLPSIFNFQVYDGLKGRAAQYKRTNSKLGVVECHIKGRNKQYPRYLMVELRNNGQVVEEDEYETTEVMLWALTNTIHLPYGPAPIVITNPSMFKQLGLVTEKATLTKLDFD